MERHAEKLVKYILAMNLAGFLTGAALYLIGDILTGLTGFLLGFFLSALLIRKKNAEANCSAGVLEELARDRR